ncbi:response regulator [Pirellulaceae bacterium]|jgi:CheY-like chemotaxis protein|nr:response regulator [Pirellulaceae bacterium]MDB4650496.1 response regulator [Pirellulaceae bacterium]
METLLETELEESLLTDKPTVLIIDDDQDQVGVLRYHLSQQGFEVLAAHSGSDGMRLLKAEMPNIVLLDIELPDATGFELCERIADDPETFQIPVIFVSGVERNDVLKRARAAGCAYYVRKPYDPNALLVLIKQTLNENLM